MRIRQRLGQPRILLIAMALIQLSWLARRKIQSPALDLNHLLVLLVCTIVISVVVSFMPTGLVLRLRQFKERLVQNEKLLILTLCVVVLTSGVIYMNYGRVTTGEVANLAAARVVAEEGITPFFANYADFEWLGDQHPPLVPLFDGLVMRVLGVHLSVMRLISVILGVATVLVTYFLGRDLYDRETGLLGALLLLSFPYLLYTGTWANNDIPVAFFFSLALFLILRLLRTPTYRLSVTAGIAIGAGLLSKYTMTFVYLVLAGYFVSDGRFRRLKRHLGIIVLVSVSILVMWLVYANHLGVLAIQYNRLAFYTGADLAESGTVRMVARWSEWAEMRFALERLPRLPFVWGLYNTLVLLVGGVCLVRRRSSSDRLILVWIAAVCFPVLLTVPVLRYFMPASPALAIAMAWGLRRVPEVAEQAIVLALFYCGEVLYVHAILP